MIQILDVLGAGKSVAMMEAVEQLPNSFYLKAYGNGPILNQAKKILDKLAQTFPGLPAFPLMQNHLKPLAYRTVATLLGKIDRKRKEGVSDITAPFHSNPL